MTGGISTTSPVLPVIRTPRLLLRPRRLEDLDACLAMDREPGTTDLIAGPWGDPAAHEAFVRARIRGPYPAGLGYWVLARPEAPEGFLGWVLLIPEDAVGPRVEIGWRMLTGARGHGFAPEAAAAVLAHGFGTVGLREVVAEIHRDNGPSRRVAEKIGMTVWEDPAEGVPEAVLYGARLDCRR